MPKLGIEQCELGTISTVTACILFRGHRFINVGDIVQIASLIKGNDENAVKGKSHDHAFVYTVINLSESLQTTSVHRRARE